ncbi:MAG: PAS domain S-box protein [Halobacteriales archaeon]
MSGYRSTIQVLHVEDESEFAELAQEFLEREDDRFEFTTANSVDDALELLSEACFDCVVSDYDLPGRNGLDFLETIRADHDDLPFILFTGKGSEAVASEAISAGVTNYIQKDTGTEQFRRLANRITDAASRSWAESNYREIFEKATDGITIHAPDSGEVIDANRRFAEMLGYEREEVIGMTAGEFSVDEPPYTAEEALQRIQDALMGEPQVFEWMDETRTGERLPVEVHLKQTTIGGQARVLALVRDISDRKERERALERERDRFTALYDNFPEPTISYTFDAGEPLIRAVNDAFEAVFGFDAETAIGRPINELLVPPDRMAEARELDAEVQSQELVDREVRRRTADGERTFRFRNIPIESTAAPDGFAVYADITERKRNEAELRQSHELIEALSTTYPDYTFIYNEAGEYLDVITGWQGGPELYSPEELVGRSVDEILGQQPAATVKSAIENTLADKELRTIEYTIDVSGDTYIYEANLAPLPDGYDGEPAVVLSARDVTDRKERERALQRQNERLEEFAQVVSHDLRNPLMVASGWVDQLREEPDPEAVDAVERAIERMEQLIDDLLRLAREGRDVESVEPIRLNELGRTAWETVETKDASLAVDTDRTIEADPDRLTQLFENLFRNAVEHGGDAVTVTIGAADEGFYVEDDGSGIPPEEQPKVFDLGYTTADTGTGFGLRIVQDIAEAHSWEVGVTTGEAGGTRFRFTDVSVV